MAKFLLGCRVVRIQEGQVLIGQIVETEAYPPGDPAAHAYRKMTKRNRSLFRERGVSYVYRAYGTAWMLNVSSEDFGVGAGVLIRALKPEVGLGIMQILRGAVPDRDLTRGPGRLAQAFAIDAGLDGLDLCINGPLFLAAGESPPAGIGVSVRIGITKAVEQPWRYFWQGSPFVSGPTRLNGSPPRQMQAAY